MIADFGLSRVMEEEKFHLLTEICGTPGYMAPEIFKKSMCYYQNHDDFTIADEGLLGSGPWEASRHMGNGCHHLLPACRLHAIRSRESATGNAGHHSRRLQIRARHVLPALPCALPDTERTEEYWANVSGTAKGFVKECLTVDPTKRPNAVSVLNHPWLADEKPHFVPDPESPTGGPTDLLPHIQKRLDARTRCKCPARTICHWIVPFT